MNKQKLKEYEQWEDEEFCLKAVEEDSDSLRYVKDQTEAVCLKAVEEDGYSLQYVKIKEVYIKIIETSK